MQRSIVFIVWTMIALLLQTVVIPDFPSIRICSDFVFYLIIIAGLKFELFSGVLVALTLGYVVDTISSVPYGTATLSYVLTVFFIRQVKANIYIENKGSLFVWIIVFSAFRQVVQYLYLVLYGRYAEPTAMMIGFSVLQSLWDAALGVVLIPMLEYFCETDLGLVFRRKGLKI